MIPWILGRDVVLSGKCFHAEDLLGLVWRRAEPRDRRWSPGTSSARPTILRGVGLGADTSTGRDGRYDRPPVEYPVESFNEAERERLRPHFTNLDRPVFALVNLPETVKAALFARYSRYPGTLRQLFLEEFADDLPAPGSLTGAGEGRRAAQLYERIFLGYGDDSVAQLGGAHVACEWVSNVLTKVLQRPRLGGYLEQSTRYIAYDAPMPDPPGRLPLLPRRRARPGLRARHGRAVRHLLPAPCPESAPGPRRSFPAPPTSRRPPTHGRSRPRRSTCCGDCSPPARCRTWASSRPARRMSS